MRKIIIFVIIILICEINVASKSSRPANVPKEAIKTKYWLFWDKNHNFTSWYLNGKLRTTVRKYKIQNLSKTISFHKNGKVRLTGFNIIDTGLYHPIDEGGPVVGEQFGLWKKYDSTGRILNESCYTIILKNKYILSEKCSIEKIYRNGKLVKTIKHKYRCMFGCSTPEEKGNPYSQKDYFTFYKPTINVLRMRARPGLKSKFIRHLKKDDIMVIRARGKIETINGKKGQWVKVITLTNETGWCFDAYLEKYEDIFSDKLVPSY